MMAVETAEPSSSEARFDWRSPQPGNLLETTEKAHFPTAAAELKRTACHTSRGKRRRTSDREASLMETNRKRSCRFDGGAATMTSRHGSARPASARYSARQDHQDEGWMSRGHLHGRRPRGAVRAEYLGVSSAAFAPPLRRYLESPKHGRQALRSPTPTSAAQRMAQSPSRSSGCATGEFPAATTPEHVGRPISGVNRERDRRATLFGQESSASCPTSLSDERHATLVDTMDESLEAFARTRAEQPIGQRPPPGLLTPVGPDWWETSPESKARSKHAAPLTHNNDDRDCTSGVDQNLVIREEIRRSIESAVGSEEEGGSYHSSHQEPSRNSNGGEDEHAPTSRDGGPLARPTVRGSHRRRRRVSRSRAWDLLTGRQVERGRRKGSGGFHVADVSSTES